MKRNILIVDKNMAVFNDLKDVLDSEVYMLFYAKSVQEALAMLETNKINLLITEVKLPDSDIITFLKRVKQQFPLSIRLAMCESSNEELHFKLFNNNLCKYLLEKPLKRHDLIKIITALFELEEKLSSRELLSIINNLDKLPVLPNIYIDVNQMIEDEDNIESIAEVIESDATMSLKILQVANSAFYRVRTGSIKTALLTLGLANIKNIILTACIFDFFDNDSHKKKQLWKHALTTNKIVLGIYRYLIKKELPNLYYSAGMLHDIGKIVLCKNYTQNYMKIFQIIQDRRITFTEAEKEVLNVCNGDVGAYLLDWWDIPMPIVEVALYHENPWEANEINRQLVAVVHIASYYAWKASNIITNEFLDDNVFDYLSISKEECLELVNNIIADIH